MGYSLQLETYKQNRARDGDTMRSGDFYLTKEDIKDSRRNISSDIKRYI